MSNDRQSSVDRIGALFAQHNASAAHLAFFLTGSKEIAEEIAQEAFVRLLGRWFTIKDPDAVRAYLNRTIVNLTRSHARKHARERTALQKKRLERAGLTHQENDVDMLDLLQDLPPRQRTALVLRFYFDQSEVQTAEVMGVSRKAVNNLVRRGIEALRKEEDSLGRGVSNQHQQPYILWCPAMGAPSIRPEDHNIL